jgi:hypothetical protein
VPRSVAAIKVVLDRRFRAVAICNVCQSTLAQGPEASAEHLAAYALGITMGIEITSAEDLIARFHRGPACPGGSMRIAIEELARSQRREGFA